MGKLKPTEEMTKIRNSLIICFSVFLLLLLTCLYVYKGYEADLNCYSSSIPAGLIEFSSPCVIVDSTGRQFISEVSRNQGPLEYMPKYEIEAYSRIDLNELSLISRENALCYYEYVDKGSQKYLIMCEKADGLPYANQLNFDGWDASFDLKLIPFTEKRRDSSMSFMKRKKQIYTSSLNYSYSV